MRLLPFGHAHIGFYTNESSGNSPQPCLENQGGGHFVFLGLITMGNIRLTCSEDQVGGHFVSLGNTLKPNPEGVSWSFLGLSTTVMAIPSANFAKENSLVRGFYLKRFFGHCKQRF